MIYRFGNTAIDDVLFEIRIGGEVVKVERRIFDLILHLLANRDRVVSTPELLDAVWAGRHVTRASVTVAITAARRALHDSREQQAVIRTVGGRGYRFVANVIESGVAVSGSTLAASFVGRVIELDALRAALELATLGRRQVCVLAGEPGIGKSRLSQEFLAKARAAGANVVDSRFLEEEGAPPYWPWLKIIRACIAAAGGTSAVPKDALIELARLLPELVSDRPERTSESSDPIRARFRLFDAVAQVVGLAAKRVPLVLSVDDVHRADKPSLLLLRFLTGQLGDLPILFLLPVRESELSRSEVHRDILGSICRETAAQTLSLRGLLASDLMQILSQEEQRSCDVEALCARTGGNPFFVTQILAYVRTRDVDTSVRYEELPATVREAILRHVELLSTSTRDVLVKSSVLGREFEEAVLVQLVGDPSAARTCLAESQAAALIERTLTGRLRFVHDLVREALYDRLSGSERAALHWRAALAMESDLGGLNGSATSELAFHMYHGAVAGDSTRALALCKRAGEAASAQLAFEEAVVQYERALDLCRVFASQDVGLRSDLHRALGAELARAGERNGARNHFLAAAELARRVGDCTRFAAAAVGSVPGFFALEAGTPDPQAISLLEEARRQEGLSLDLRAVVLGRLAMARAWLDDPSERLALTMEAQSIADSSGDIDLAFQVLLARWFAEWDPATFDERWQIAARLMKLADAKSDHEAALLARLYWATCLLERGELQAFQQQVVLFDHAAEKLRQPEALWYSALLKACLALHSGRMDEGEQLSSRFAELGSLVQDANVFHSRMTHRVLLSWERARYDEMVSVSTQAAERYPTVIGWRATRAWSLALAGRKEDCQREFDEICESGVELIPRRMDWAVTMAFLAEVACVLRAEQEAESIYRLLMPLRHRTILLGLCVASWGCASRYLGKLAALLGYQEEADHLLSEAVAVDDASGARAWGARARYELARLRSTSLVAAGDDTANEQTFNEAWGTAAELGLHDLVRRLASLRR